MTQRRVRITSDGTMFGTRVVDAETGDPIPKVCRIEFAPMVPGQLPAATITVMTPILDIVVDAEIVAQQPSAEGDDDGGA